MNNIGKTQVIANIPAMFCAALAAVMALFGAEGWGWMILLALCMVVTVRTKKENENA